MILIIVMLLSLFELISVIQFRKSIQPAFQILSPNLLKYLRQTYPHQSEILQFFISVVQRASYVPDSFMWFCLMLMIADP